MYKCLSETPHCLFKNIGTGTQGASWINKLSIRNFTCSGDEGWLWFMANIENTIWNEPGLKGILLANVISPERTIDLSHLNWTISITFPYNFRIGADWVFISSTVPCLYPWRKNEVQRGKICINQSHTGYVATAKARIQVFSSDSVNILLCHHQYHHHQRVSVASIICIMKYSPSPISSGEAGLRKWCQFLELCLGRRKWFINVSFIKDHRLPPVYRGPLQEHHSRRLWRADEKSVVGSQEGSQEGWGHRRRRHAAVGKSRQTLPGPALSLLTESVDTSYKRTDSWLPKSL